MTKLNMMKLLFVPALFAEYRTARF